jgi:hypothetical protein
VSSPSNEPTFRRDAPRILAVLFRIGFILGFLLTPVGLETRRKFLRSPAIAGFFIFVGLLAPLAGLILLLFRRPKPAGILAVVDAGLLILAAPADQAKLFFTVPPPPAVTVGESALALLGIGYVLYGFRASREADESRRAVAAAS